MKFEAVLSVTLLGALSLAQQPLWGQCGGQNWTGATTCVSGACCIAQNPYYSQCLASSGSCSGGSPSSVPTTMTTTTRPGTTTRPSTTTTSGPGPTGGTGTAPPSTLQSGYYWIRAVQDPNFHKYLQTSPVRSAGAAILSSPSSAGQFKLEGGQLIYMVDTSGTQLYLTVETRTDSSVMQLALSFSTSRNTYGTFNWSGDALQWTEPSITRPNPSAWLINASTHQVYANLGNYGYQTPAGYNDATIHYYNGATADA